MAYTTINKHTDYFNTKLYTGNGSTQSITGVGFQPDWVWVKNRDIGTDAPTTYDAVRGATKRLQTSSTGAESTKTNGLTAFGSDGYTAGSASAINANGSNLVSWNWKAGTTGSGNTTGSGTYKSYSYSVNTTAGFSIVKYIGNGNAAQTVPHHLGTTPAMVIVKNLDATVDGWQVYHKNLTSGKGLGLNNTNQEYDATVNGLQKGIMGVPTSTNLTFVSGYASQQNVNGNDVNYIAYCFAEKTGYSKFGKYIGNASSDGTFVYTGFKPSFLMVKRTDSTSDWLICDNKRNNHSITYPTNNINPVNGKIFANLNQAEEFYNSFDFLSNGFKIKTSGTGHNASGANMIYMAFGQSLVGSNNIPCTAR